LQIGRGRDNDVVLADQEKGVSRTHAELRFENGRYVIVDLQSQNGTWINGRRVDRAEVPPGTEITIGDYRLTLHRESPARPASPSAGATIARHVRDVGDLQIRERPERAPYHPAPQHPQPVAQAAQPRNALVAVVLVVAAVILFGAVAWVFGPAGRDTLDRPDAAEPNPAESRPADASVPPPPAGVAAPERASEATEPFTAKPEVPRRSSTVRPKPERVARKPGESVESWRSRSEALETRYAYSKAALDRRDYAAAAGGFQAILLEEPGFLDAPRLLVQANEGLRATANGLFQAGRRMDAAGDWLGALQKYEQARQIYSGIPGITEATARVRDKLRTAGTKAFAHARELDALGRKADALKEYEKAVQWLPADDPNRQAARARIEQLKRNQ
jgi:tetratricopeptide (TPR) repeat protein